MLSAAKHLVRNAAEYSRYGVILNWSDEDQVFIAEVPELPGCMAHGDSQEEALANAHEAMQLWVDAALECGDPIPETKGSRLMTLKVM